MKKRVLTVILVTITAVSGLAAAHSRSEITAPVCRFVGFYFAAEQSDMTVLERVMFALAVAREKKHTGCSVQPMPASEQASSPE